MKSVAAYKLRQCVNLVQQVTRPPECDHGDQHNENQEQYGHDYKSPKQGLVRKLHGRYRPDHTFDHKQSKCEERKRVADDC